MPRTNSLIITDTAAKLAEIRELLTQVDIPVRQVMIEARIVIAQSDATKNLGIEWGGAYLNKGNNSVLSASGDTDNVVGLNESAINGTTPTVSYPGALLVDLGVASNSGFALGFASGDLFLTAELSALEAEGEGEVVSQPKVITGDKQEALIKSGVEIPYQESSASGETTVAFKDAVLQLLVTPNITPDDRILLDLAGQPGYRGQAGTQWQRWLYSLHRYDAAHHQRTGGQWGNGGVGWRVQNRGYRAVNKVPYFGDIPYIGAFFRSETNEHKKTELLIFVTPRILAETLLD